MRQLAIALILVLNIQFTTSAYQNISRIDIDFDQAYDDLDLSSIVQDVQLIPLSAIPDSFIGKIDKVLMTKDYIFVLDRFRAGCVFQFTLDGAFVRKVGATGPGPQEYETPSDFTIDGNKIHILDNGAGIVTYDTNGAFIEKTIIRTTNGFYFEKLKNGWAFVGGSQQSNLVITDNDFNIKKTFFPYISRSVDRIIINPLFKTGNGDVLYRRNLRDTMYKVSLEGIEPHLIINQKTRPFDLDQLKAGETDEFMSDDVNDFSVTKQIYISDNSVYNMTRFRSQNWVTIKASGSDQPVTFKTKNLTNDLTFSQSFLYPKGTYKAYIIYILSAESFGVDMSQAQEENKTIPDNVRELASSVSGDDNPVLLLLKYNDGQ